LSARRLDLYDLAGEHVERDHAAGLNVAEIERLAILVQVNVAVGFRLQ